MTNYRRSVGLFYSREEAEIALRALKDDGFDMRRVNLIAKNADSVTQAVGVDVRDNVGEGATSGALLGGLGGLLIGLGTLAIPGVGPIIVAGEIGTAIATTLAGAGIGAATGGLVGALVDLGIPEDEAKIYNDRVASGGYLIVIDGSDVDVARAEIILQTNGIKDYGVYNAHDITDDIYNKV